MARITSLLALLAGIHLPTALSLAITPEPTPSRHALAKRMVFTPGGRNDFCIEGTPQLRFGPDTPLVSDCRAIVDNLHGASGSWAVAPGDFDGADHRGWATLGASGTCKFAVGVNSQTPLQTIVFGTNDLQFYLEETLHQAQDGRVEGTGTVVCNNGTGNVQLYVNWGVLHT